MKCDPNLFMKPWENDLGKRYIQDIYELNSKMCGSTYRPLLMRCEQLKDTKHRKTALGMCQVILDPQNMDGLAL